MKPFFLYDERLGIPLPNLDREWETYTKSEQTEIIAEWEKIRAQIPVQARKFERLFMETFELLNQATDSEEIGILSQKMGDLSSIINELNVLDRQDPRISHK